MIPSLLIAGVGRRRRVPIPLPLFLLWPFVILAFVIVWVLRLFAPRGSGSEWTLSLALYGLCLLFHLSGIVIDVRSQDGSGVLLRLI